MLLPAKITLTNDWQWLLDGTPLKQNRGVSIEGADGSRQHPFKENGGVRDGRVGEKV